MNSDNPALSFGVWELARDIWETISRRKTCEVSNSTQEPKRTLTLVDITCLGIISTLGTGIYVILGQVSREHAGPSVVLSYLYSSVATFLTGLCYAELGSRFPRAGSAYVYAYATAGELVGFLIGWNLILELALGASVASKACVQYVDALSNHSLSTCLQDKGVGVPLVAGVKPLDRSLDLPASILVIIITIALLINVKMLCMFNNFLTSLGILLLAALIAVGISNTDARNWTKGPGFFPNGVSGILCAASTSTYSFIGYEIMAGAAGETLTSHGQVLSNANVCAFVLGLLVAFPTAVFLTLFIPFHRINEQAPFVHAFESPGLSVGVKYLVVIGAFSALLGSLIATLFALSRLLHKMSEDGLLFRSLNRVSSKTGIPWSSTLIGGISVSAITLIIDQHTLVDILGFGVLLSSVSIAASILVLRYGVHLHSQAENINSEESPTNTPPFTWHYLDGSWIKLTPSNSPQSNLDLKETTQLLSDEIQDDPPNSNKSSPEDETGNKQNKHHRYGSNNIPRQMAVEYINDAFSVSLLTERIPKPVPTPSSSRNSAVIIFSIVSLVALVAIFNLEWQKTPFVAEILTIIAVILGIILCILLLRQPKHSPRVRHKVPCIPALPVGVILLQVPLLVYLPLDAWLRTFVWTFMGLVIYVLYSARYSKERSPSEDEDLLINGMVKSNDDQVQIE